jgi:hypothetical protein
MSDSGHERVLPIVAGIAMCLFRQPLTDMTGGVQ